MQLPEYTPSVYSTWDKYITLDLIEKKVERNNEGKFPFLCLIMCVYPVSIMLRKWLVSGSGPFFRTKESFKLCFTTYYDFLPGLLFWLRWLFCNDKKPTYLPIWFILPHHCAVLALIILILLLPYVDVTLCVLQLCMSFPSYFRHLW